MASILIRMQSALLLVLLVQVAGLPNLRATDYIPYVSPGLKIGWDSNRGFTMGPKIGIGLANLDKHVFINLTVGIKSFQTGADDNNKFVFLDVQIGSSRVSESSIPFGGGVGLLFSKPDGEVQIRPRTTIFVGFIVFPTLDFNFWDEDQVAYESGFELVLPIPLKKIDLGLE